MSTPNTPVPRQSDKPSHRTRLVLIALGIVLVALAVLGILQRVHARRELSEDTDRQAVPIVATLTPKAAPEDQSLTLPGTVNSWQDAQIYARTTGYVAKWYVDIGTRVKKDQRLADLDTPDVDNELLQGQAQMRTDEANEKLAKVTADRYEVLVKQGLVALQTGDQYVAQLNADIATVEADRHRRVTFGSCGPWLQVPAVVAASGSGNQVPHHSPAAGWRRQSAGGPRRR